eukprot:g40392.t1
MLHAFVFAVNMFVSFTHNDNLSCFLGVHLWSGDPVLTRTRVNTHTNQDQNTLFVMADGREVSSWRTVSFWLGYLPRGLRAEGKSAMEDWRTWLACSNLALAAFGFYWWFRVLPARRALKPEGLRIKNIYIYPVKSCAGVEVPFADISAMGLEHDRTFLVVKAQPDDAGVHDFLTQRERPRMALIQPAFHELGSGEASMSLQGPGASTLRVALSSEKRSSRGPTAKVRVWGDVMEAELVGQEADLWLSQFLETEACLVRVLPVDAHKRAIKPDYVPPGVQQVKNAFPDGFPFLLATSSSLAALNQVQQQEESTKPSVNILQFRPNIVVEGPHLEPWVEDHWTRLAVIPNQAPGQPIGFHGVKACSRCSVPNVQIATGTQDPSLSVSKLLRKHRLRGQENAVFFGQHLIQEDSSIGRRVCVGDRVTVVETVIWQFHALKQWHPLQLLLIWPHTSKPWLRFSLDLFDS